MHSPLYKTRHSLKVFRWTCGFPLQAKDSSYTSFRFVTWLETIRFIIVFLFLRLTYLYVLSWNLIYDGGFSTFIRFYEDAFNKFSGSKVDQITTVVWHCSVNVNMIAYIVMFKYSAKPISVYCKEISAVKSKIYCNLVEKTEPNSCCEIQSPEKTIIYQQIINVIASCLAGTWIYIFFFATMHREAISNYGSKFAGGYAAFMGIETFFFAFGPLSCAVELIICQLINSLSDVFDVWTKLLKQNSDLKTACNTPNTQKNDCHASAIDVELCET